MVASVYKIIISHRSKFKHFKNISTELRINHLSYSAGATGILWCFPVFMSNFSNPIELATIVLIVSGIISGAVNAYIGNVLCISLIATFPCASIVLCLGIAIDPIPVATIVSVFIFWIFIIFISFKTRESVLDLLVARFENSELIEELRKVHEQLKGIANKDNLTGLPNRRLLYEFFFQLSNRSVRCGKKIAVLFIDLDKFKPINDTYGHEIGDKVLIAVSSIMQNTIRNSDIVARLGGDEFVAMFDNLDNAEDAFRVASKLCNALKTTIFVDAYSIPISASVGVAVFPDDADNLDKLLNIADATMYDAKKLKTIAK